ncbi:MAG: biotin--[acetyl-CoA-carboxylase] ligase [Fimbriimonadaceae bacterium]|nr:biotin--[acetyl-CoA-carboxylase] ligase [Fimbriimonadaceae bacterium]
MKSPLLTGSWVELETVDSTQAEASRRLKAGEDVGAVFAHHQEAGRGRFGRTWISRRDESLTVSFVFRDYADHPKPWLVGMSVALAVAGAVRAQLRWPNDVTIRGKKVGGILTEMCVDDKGRRVPVVGVGVNLGPLALPVGVREFATSLAIERRGDLSAEGLARLVVAGFDALPEPDDWAELAPIWRVFDDTPGKRYKTLDGEDAIGIGIGPEGELVATVEGETVAILAAEAIFGRVNETST